jgi:hypothetical protein
VVKWFSIAIVIQLLAGCSAEWHLKKAIKKNPALLSEPTVVTRWDTITMPPITIVDTLEIPAVGDSSVIENDSLQVVVKTVVDKNGNKKLSVSAKTKTIQIPHYIKVDCPPQVKLLAIPWYYKVYKMSFFILIFLLIVALARRISSRFV